MHLGAQNGYQIKLLEDLLIHLSKVDSEVLFVHLRFVLHEKISSVMKNILMQKKKLLMQKVNCASEKISCASKMMHKKFKMMQKLFDSQRQIDAQAN